MSRSGTRLIQALVLGVAVVVCAWFALGIRQAHDTAGATAVVTSSQTPTPAQVRHAQSLLDAAKTLNPDLTVTVLRGELALRTGQRQQALALFQQAARDEPDNLEAWLGVAHASGGRSAVLFAALRRIRALEPRLPFAH